jgi:hypothetical protein
MIETTYFKEKEMACKCGCGTCNINPTFVNKLDHARRLAGVSFPVTSACRCAKHNRKVGGVAESSHLSVPGALECTAADLGIFDSVSRFKVVKALIEAGFSRIGIGKGLIHVDSDTTKDQGVIWLYADK